MKTLIKHAVIYTLDEKNTVAEALVMEDSKVLQTGTEKALRAAYGEEMQEIDMEGRSVLPAFHDSHLHLLGYSRFLGMADLYQVESIEALQKRMREFMAENGVKAGEWVRGRGWNQDYFEVVKLPTKEDLDAISTECPLVITRACGHMLAANSKALEVCRIEERLGEINPKEIELGADGKPNGILKEGGMSFIYRCIPEPDLETLKEYIVKGQEKLLEQGITAVQSDDFGNAGSYETAIQAFRELEQEGRLKIKVYEQCNLGSLSMLKDFFKKGYNKKTDGGQYRLGCLKIIGDGSLGARTAWMRKLYADSLDTAGIACYSREELFEYMKYAHDRDMQIAIHCIGDAMVECALDCFERLQRENPKPDIRHGIVHCQITDETLLKRIAENHILVYMQPIFLNYDLHIVEARVGKELAKTSYSWKSLLDYGASLSVGSDCPVESFDSMNNIYSAVTRKDLTGYPEQGFYPEQRLSVQETVEAFTIGSAYAAHNEKLQGSLEAGKYADMVVLDTDIFKCEPDVIQHVRIWKTFADGKLVYSADKQ